MGLQQHNGAQLWVEDSGTLNDRRPIIVFSHGLLFSTALFAPQIAALRDRYRCVAYDHRGQGKSADSELRCIDMELLYQDAVALLESLSTMGRPVHFVGLSMGGFVAMRLAARRPDLIASLSLLETSADPEPNENVLRYRALSSVVRVFGVGAVASRVMPIMFAQSVLADPSRAAEVAQWRVQLTGNRRSIWRAVNGVIERTAIYPELKQIRCPTVVVVGDEDVATVPAKAERIAAAISGASLIRVPRAGHSSTLEAPDAVTDIVKSHISAVRSL
jgi:3-oxoadipate enol-lactonase